MKKRKKLIKRIGALLCALVVAVSSLGVSAPFRAETVSNVSDYPACPSGYEYVVLFFNDNYRIYQAPVFYFDYDDAESLGCGSALYCSYSNSYPMRYYVYDKNYYEWSYVNATSSGSPRNVLYKISCSIPQADRVLNIVYSSCDIYDVEGNLIFKKSGESYNSTFGYLQNVSRKSTYIRDALYNYDDDSLTYHWYHDLQSTSGVDLTSGEYKIRHYISNATVTGYGKGDIVEMSDKYLMAEYDASQGYFSYLQKDYLDKLTELGCEELGFIDVYLKGYFTLQHHYFQIVNTSTNEVGGYLHFYPKDATDDNFGVEMEFEGLDDNFDVDENGPSGYIDTPNGSGETVEDALENADEPKLDDLSGVEEFIDVVKAYGSEVENVSNGVGALFGQFPPWVLGVLGLSFALLIIGVVVSAMKG